MELMLWSGLVRDKHAREDSLVVRMMRFCKWLKMAFGNALGLGALDKGLLLLGKIAIWIRCKGKVGFFGIDFVKIDLMR